MNIQKTTIRVPKNILEEIKIYCRKSGNPVGEFVETAWDFIKKNNFDIYDKEGTPFVSIPLARESQKEEIQNIDSLCKLMAEFIVSSERNRHKLLSDSDMMIRASKADLRAEELERELQKTEQRLKELESYKEKAHSELERIKKEQSFFGKIKINEI